MESIIGLILSVVAVLISLAALGYTRAQVIQAKRANALLEAEQQRQLDRDNADALANRVRWRVDPLGNKNFVLRNTGTDSAYKVKVSSPSVQFLGGRIVKDAFSASGSGILVAEVVEPGGGLKFTATHPSPHSGEGYELIVDWRGAAAV